jgi:hypothetical protein
VVVLVDWIRIWSIKVVAQWIQQIFEVLWIQMVQRTNMYKPWILVDQAISGFELM